MIFSPFSSMFLRIMNVLKNCTDREMSMAQFDNKGLFLTVTTAHKLLWLIEFQTYSPCTTQFEKRAFYLKYLIRNNNL